MAIRSVITNRSWRAPKVVIALFAIEFALTIAVLALFGIAAPDLYRTRLWQDGYDNGFNSSPDEVLYAAANYKSITTPLCWSQFITNFNVVISVLSMFILLAKSVMFVMHVFYPLLSILVHGMLIALYAVSLHAQATPDLSDPTHPQHGAPWYITKSCSVVHDPSNKGYCQQAKASFGVTIAMLALFLAYELPSLFSLICAVRSRSQDPERIPSTYRPEPKRPGPDEMRAWGEKLSQDYVALRTPGTTGGIKSPGLPLATPRTVAFQRLEGRGQGQGHRQGNQAMAFGPKKEKGKAAAVIARALPFREAYGGPDGR